jgi:hypothetical protein
LPAEADSGARFVPGEAAAGIPPAHPPHIIQARPNAARRFVGGAAVATRAAWTPTRARGGRGGSAAGEVSG